MNLPTLGSDPEIVAVASSVEVLQRRNIPTSLLNLPMPAYYALGIDDPEMADIPLPYGILTPDGMAPEFTVEPTDSVSEIVARIGVNLAATNQILAANGAIMSVDPHFPTDPWYIERLPAVFGNKCSLQIFGCAPDGCMYDVQLPQRPNPLTYFYRTSGGHIHIGVGQTILADRALLGYTVALLDTLIGTAATYLCTSQQAFDRKRLYGSAGMVRTNGEVGTLEYRTLPAQALIATPELSTLMFTGAQQSAALVMRMLEETSQTETVSFLADRVGSYQDIVTGVVPAINAHNVDECRRHQERLGDVLQEFAPVIDRLQAYKLHDTFELRGW